MGASSHTCMRGRSKGPEVVPALAGSPPCWAWPACCQMLARAPHPSPIAAAAHPSGCYLASQRPALPHCSSATMLSCAPQAVGSAPPVALQQRHCAQQQQQHLPASVQPRHCGRSAAGAAACRAGASALAATAPPSPLDRSYRASPLSCDILSEQRQQYYTQMGAAIRALQKVRGVEGRAWWL